VWPDDPVEADSGGEAEPAKTSSDPSWPSTFEDVLKQSQAASEPAATAPAPAQAPAASEPVNEYPTEPSMPAIPAAKTEPPAAAAGVAKTVPPEPAATEEEPQPVLGTADELPTSTFKTPIPGPVEVSSSNGAEGPAMEAASAAVTEAEPEPASEPVRTAAEPEPEPVEAAEPEPEPVKAADEEEPEPVKAPEPEPEPEPAKEPGPEPEPVKAAEPEPASKDEEWIPLPANPSIPAWAPKFGAPAVAAEQKVDWGASNPLPAWAPIAGGRTTTNMPAASRISSTPAAPSASQPPKPAAAPAPVAPSQPPASPGASQPPAAEGSKTKSSSWEIVQPKVDQPRQAYAGPSAEDKSYAEWFAWAKRSGAPAGACHAAAQGAFRALAAGHDMNTAVQWATLAMGQPPGLVSASRQLYCAWYSLGNIDLRLASPQAHAFATGAIAALEGGADAPTAHQAGLTAAGVMG